MSYAENELKLVMFACDRRMCRIHGEYGEYEEHTVLESRERKWRSNRGQPEYHEEKTDVHTDRNIVRMSALYSHGTSALYNHGMSALYNRGFRPCINVKAATFIATVHRNLQLIP